MNDNTVTSHLELARQGEEHSRNSVARWLLEHVRSRVINHARESHLPDSLSAIEGDVIAKLMRSDVIGNADNRGYLIGTTTMAINEVIADTWRRMGRKKRRADGTRQPMELMVETLQAEGLDVSGLTDALRDLSQRNPRQFQVVVLRYFGGLTVPEVADELQISVSTVESDWRAARLWLFQQLSDE